MEIKTKGKVFVEKVNALADGLGVDFLMFSFDRTDDGHLMSTVHHLNGNDLMNCMASILEDSDLFPALAMTMVHNALHKKKEEDSNGKTIN